MTLSQNGIVSTNCNFSLNNLGLNDISIQAVGIENGQNDINVATKESKEVPNDIISSKRPNGYVLRTLEQA